MNCTYPYTPENIEAAHRRAERIHAMNNGQQIPHPESAEADMRPGSAEDRHVVAMVKGREIRERISPSSPEFANAIGETRLGIGPVVASIW